MNSCFCLVIYTGQVIGQLNTTTSILLDGTLHSMGYGIFQSFINLFIKFPIYFLTHWASTHCQAGPTLWLAMWSQCGLTTYWFGKTSKQITHVSPGTCLRNENTIGFWLWCSLPLSGMFFPFLILSPGIQVPHRAVSSASLDNMPCSWFPSSPDGLLDLRVHLLRATLSFSDRG